MRDFLNQAFPNVNKREHKLMKKSKRLHYDSIGGLNNAIWIRDFDAEVLSYVSPDNLKYLDFTPLPIARPMKP